MTPSPGTQLGPYEVTRQLGAGGMGVVYEARDPRLDRTVAIKVLPPDLTQDETAKQRFLQEAKAASALDHPNICTIHDVGETDDGQLYLVMAHYEGETLKERIARGRLPVDEAVDIATQVGQGLAKAHAAGIVHRDIKPANLMVTADGTVKILDFGLAKLAGLEGVTQTGTTVGTVAYMSPEQARGEEVDHRTDIWSLGVVLYEMLAGEPPFQGENLLSLAEAIRSGEPGPLTGEATSLDPVLRKTLSKDSAQRFQAVTDLASELRSPSASPAPLAAAVAESDVPSIAVLPFADMSPEKDQDYFCEGMAEEIINALTRLENLRVVARTSAFQFKGQTLDLREVGRRLDVASVLEGSVRKAGDRLRVTAQLINVNDGCHLWSERFDRTMADVFDVQDEVARTVTEKLQVGLLGQPTASLVAVPTRNLDAYNLFLQGRQCYTQTTRPALERALRYFAQAMDLEPDYPEARAGLARVRTFQAVYSFGPPRELMPEAKDAALRALASDDSVGEAHAALANVLDLFEWKWPEAEEEYRRALDLQPGDPFTRGQYADLLGRQGRGDASVAEARRAVECDPLSPFCRHYLSLALAYTGQFDAALAEAQAGIDIDPSYHLLYQMLANAFAGLGRLDEAIAALRRQGEFAAGDPMPLCNLCLRLGFAGYREEASTILHELEGRRADEYISAVLLAYCHAGLDQRDDAISWLNTAYEERDALMPFIFRYPGLEQLRPDARFQTLLSKMNFAHPRDPVVSVESEPVDGAVTTAVVTAVEPDVPSIAVLPFADLSPEKDQEYFCDGLAEELIDALARLDGLRVVGRTSSFQFRGERHDLREVGEKLHVGTVLEGSVRRAGSRLRVNAQLINTEDGYHLWSERYDREMADVFDVQDEIAGAVVAELRSQLRVSPAVPRVARPTENLKAYRAFAQAHHHRVSRYDPATAIPLYEEAIREDPSYAEAHAGLAECVVLMGVSGTWSSTKAAATAKHAVGQALAANDALSQVHAAKARTLFLFDWRWDDAEVAFQRALALSPANADALVGYCGFLGLTGRTEEALRCAERILVDDPLSTYASGQAAVALYVGRRDNEAAAAARQALELQPGYALGLWYLSLTARTRTACQQAVRELRTIPDTAGRMTAHQGFLGRALAVAGEEGEARAMLTLPPNRSERTAGSHVWGALIHNGLGEFDEALNCLERAYAHREPGLIMLLWPEWDTVRSDARFQKLLRDMSFPEPVTFPS